ncbi:MAG TPA: adenylate cyclase, partial [Flavobacteriaceae bacterium]|nr:adenylate cyclase [Flavobacteriaceae bacterium]
MKFEIERKFLVKNTTFKEQAVKRIHIIQAYLSKD